MTRHQRIVVLTWNLFHGRDAPPNPRLATWRSRIARVTERDDTHVQVNRGLLTEFATVLAALEWDIALLQEAPPRWLRPLARQLGASGASALTARNAIPWLRSLLARVNPDLMASAEGGSNQVLVRPPWRIEAVERETITRRPERRRVLLVRAAGPSGRRIAVANLHASTGDGARTAADVLRAAEVAAAWAGELPLVFGGDLNATQEGAPDLFRTLEQGYGLGAATGGGAIDHLLARNLVPLEAPHPLPASTREIPQPDGRAIRLSDHPCVVGTFGVE